MDRERNGSQRRFIWGVGPESLCQITGAEYETEPDSITSRERPKSAPYLSSTRRERLKSALYLWLKKRKRPFLKKTWIFEFFSFRKCHIVPKKVKGGPVARFCCKISKNLKGGPFWDIGKFSKKSRTMPKKIERGDPLVSSGFVEYVKFVKKNERGTLLH